MLTKPPSCTNCPLAELSTGFMRPTLASGDPYRVALVGEALGEDEAAEGAAFVGKAGFKLTRLIQWAGLDRSRFDIWNAVWCRPPNNKLEGQPFESDAIAHCRTHHWGKLLERPNRVIVPMGNVPTNAFLGWKGILTGRGYVYPGPGTTHLIPTVHPSFIQRGQSKWSAAFINDLQKAVELARVGLPIVLSDYLLDPSPSRALDWAKDYIRTLRDNPATRLAFDIETPGKAEEDEDELDVGLDPEQLSDKTWHIYRIGFSYRGHAALSVPWSPEFIPAIRLLLASAGDKVVWNAGFDVPRVRRAGVPINGLIHDGMVAWHILHSDLPKRLGFVATFTCPWQPAWKHLSGSKPAFYNATDADVELRSMDVISSELKRIGLWEVYQRDVIDLEPVLAHMHERGMPIDTDTRIERAGRLRDRLQSVRQDMERSVPLEARRIDHVYMRPPADTSGCLTRPGIREVPVCAACGYERPTKHHFRVLKKTKNPCEAAGTRTESREVTEFYRLADFTPSREQLIRYHQLKGRPLPMVWDKKAGKRRVSFGERQLKDLTAKHRDDKLYSSILDYRALDKIAGTYIGKLTDD